MAIYLAGQSKTTQHDGLSRFYFRQARQGRPPRQASDSSCPASFAAAALLLREETRAVDATRDSQLAPAGHERAAVLREIFDSLDDGDFQISRAEYVRLMGTRGVAAAEANVGAFPLHPHLHLLLGDIRRHGQLGQQSHDSSEVATLRPNPRGKRIARFAPTATRRRPTPSPSS